MGVLAAAVMTYPEASTAVALMFVCSGMCALIVVLLHEDRSAPVVLAVVVPAVGRVSMPPAPPDPPLVNPCFGAYVAARSAAVTAQLHAGVRS